ncbi:Hypothetical protein A7982_03649 [Minicystis rosea]|nr:Hypothetical protein A7982_03649 [Minicystis rosea]
MSTMRLSWGFDPGPKARAEHLAAPTWADVEDKLARLAAAHTGSIKLELQPAPTLGPQSLQAIAENGTYLVMLGEMIEVDGDVDHNVRTLYDASATPGKTLIMGDFWDARQTSREPAVVRDVFKDFFETGDVSADKLS